MQLLYNMQAAPAGPASDNLTSLYKQGTALRPSSKIILDEKNQYIRDCFAIAIEAGLYSYNIVELLEKLFDYDKAKALFYLRSIPLTEATKLRGILESNFAVGSKSSFALLDWESSRY